MKKLLFLFLCLTLTCAYTSASGDDAALRDALAAGRKLVLTETDLPGGEENLMPCSISPDGATVLWRSAEGLILTREGTAIPVHAAPERGSGDPYGRLEAEVQTISFAFPSLEGVSWSPDGKFFTLSSQDTCLKRGTFMDLILVDTANGEAFAVQSWDSAVRSDDFGTVVEARFDATGAYIWFIGRIRAIAENYGLFRYSMAENRTELVLEDIGISSARRMLFEDADGGWLIMAGSGMAGQGDTYDTFLRYRPSADLLSRLFGGSSAVDRSVRRLKTGMMCAVQGGYSNESGYGLSLAFSKAAASQSSISREPGYDSIMKITMLFTMPRLNRITPEGIDLDRYWELAVDPKDPASMRLVETDPELVNLMTLHAARDISEEEWNRLIGYGEDLAAADLPTLSCLCMSPGGHYAVLAAHTRGRQALYWLVDTVSMALYPVEIPDTLGPVYYGTDFGVQYRPGIEWNGDILLVYNSKESSVEAYRLEAK